MLFLGAKDSRAPPSPPAARQLCRSRDVSEPGRGKGFPVGFVLGLYRGGWRRAGRDQAVESSGGEMNPNERAVREVAERGEEISSAGANCAITSLTNPPKSRFSRAGGSSSSEETLVQVFVQRWPGRASRPWHSDTLAGVIKNNSSL